MVVDRDTTLHASRHSILAIPEMLIFRWYRTSGPIPTMRMQIRTNEKAKIKSEVALLVTERVLGVVPL